MLAKTLAIAAALAVMPFAASALTVTESTDFANSFTFALPSLGSLSAGTNTISGALLGQCLNEGDCNSGVPGSGDTQDSAVVTPGPGLIITSVTVTTSNVTGPSFFRPLFELIDQPNTFDLLPILVSNGSTGNLIGSSLGPASYGFSLYSSANAPGNFGFNYTVTFESADDGAVRPEASTWLMMIAAFGLTGAALRRRVRSA